MLREAKIDEQANPLTLVLELQEPTPSASGKTLVVGTTHGNVPTDVKVNDQPMILGPGSRRTELLVARRLASDVEARIIRNV